MTLPRAVSIEELLAAYPPRIQRLAEAARTRIQAAVPEAVEKLRAGWRLIGYNAPAYFAFLSLERDHVRIGFEWGVMLRDQAGLLQGEGSQVRYVVVKAAKDLRSPGLTLLLREAAALQPPPRGPRQARG